MSEDVARALGASNPFTLSIAGQQCQARPLGIKELTEVERECLARYKREYLITWKQNLDLLPESDRLVTLSRKMDEVAKWDVDQLPGKFSHDPSYIQVTPALREWCLRVMGIADATDARVCVLTSVALDQGMLTEEEFKQMTGKPSIKIRIPYVNWWITGSIDGMITFIWMCFRDKGITREQVQEELGNNVSLLSEMAHEIERLSAPQSGNG